MKIFVDMDGVIYPWNKEVDPRLLWTKIYYENMPAEQDMISTLDEYKEKAELFVLSCYLNDEAKAGKNAALDKLGGLFPADHRIFVPYGKNKAEYAEKVIGQKLDQNCILFDDHSPNCLSWQEAGGRAVKILNDINGKGEIWKGERMYRDGTVPSKSILPTSRLILS